MSIREQNAVIVPQNNHLCSQISKLKMLEMLHTQVGKFCVETLGKQEMQVT